MGYYTEYNLTVLGVDGTEETRAFLDMAKNIKNHVNRYDLFKPEYAQKMEKAVKVLEGLDVSLLDDVLDNALFTGQNKWYDHEAHMRDISTAFPEYIFQLDGVGEESGDIWRKFFRNGKMQGGKATLIFPKYDPEK